MSATLNISRLIEVAEELCYSGTINYASEGKQVVQEILIAGKVFEIEIVVKLKTQNYEQSTIHKLAQQ